MICIHPLTRITPLISIFLIHIIHIYVFIQLILLLSGGIRDTGVVI